MIVRDWTILPTKFRYLTTVRGLNIKHWNTKCFDVKISNGLVLETSIIAKAIAMVPTTPKPKHCKSKQNGCHFVRIFNGFLPKWLPFCSKRFICHLQVVSHGTIAYIDIYWTDHWKTEHPNTEHENVRFSNGFSFWMFRIWAPTVNVIPHKYCTFSTESEQYFISFRFLENPTIAQQRCRSFRMSIFQVYFYFCMRRRKLFSAACFTRIKFSRCNSCFTVEIQIQWGSKCYPTAILTVFPINIILFLLA